MMPARSFVPALGFDVLTPLYDAVVRLMLREAVVKGRLVAQARIAPGMAVLDVGCGTGTLAIMVKRTVPGARVVGIDVDPQILTIARRKAAAAAIEVELRQGAADAADLPPASFDRVLTSFVLHHLTTDEKRAALAAVRRLLRPVGELHIADFGPPQNALMWLVAHSVQVFDGADRLAANLSGQLPDLVVEAGFRTVAETWHTMTPFGTAVLWRAEA